MIFFSILITIFAYFLGSISSAILICKILRFPDPRNFGSKNPGATNILRIAGLKIAISVILFDILKGAIPMWLGYHLKISPIFLGATAVFSCLGHMYPIFFKFYGGKGVATAFGVLTTIDLHLSIVMISSWTLTVLSFGYSSLGAIVTAFIIPCYAWHFQSQYLLPTIIISSLVVIKHAANIKRLWHHKENRIWRK
ncbi:putative membrane protein [Candidatus Blochmanniella pennsylvanica str. BPEN]|uniref:Glycerol-3-phosphate acyltransferase n=1 Tax=Blochmanniella pennsylvanica (strain BPEN) TaxID=291272 RepID=PLSY_BLOPB|nr:glycerol-3-phosphate 1-O-acyltransferase PlsY [Candidatus Blochmannia pennsylvanicus]Q493X7.1 RecName: Full=Glycerol-3-phosphate acyltransferase; AltName: Full=Acyl-PO4 G3P acyltransferase; AltName: Full=Acyl-phosphate--glycerol-3-phosphate acyltransferase; AltName: Full=G3P acyltransferase; Short=GPAT; AltName: Full=Lysophosphatidic acid synthase; Short=LPA synthase [Candidatus Blochmannia pennsylvanicus str. BPEN]AAZ40707.1 putative membrane protein [Candidatus Blochmannia pennsylvanicus str